MRYVAAVMIGAVALAVGASAMAQEDDDGPLTASWAAIELNGRPVEGPTLDYTTDKASGTGGCNRFNGPITIEDDAIQIGPLASTKMMCEGKAETETQYFTALQAARTFVVKDGMLVLKAEDGHVLARFKK